MTSHKCPNCGTKNLMERGSNSLRNIRLRKKNNRYDDFYCEKCKETFSEEQVDLSLQRDIDAKEAIDW